MSDYQFHFKIYLNFQNIPSFILIVYFIILIDLIDYYWIIYLPCSSFMIF